MQKPERLAGRAQAVLFGPYRVDLRTGDLWKHGVRLRLQEQPFCVLKLLLERPGELVTREELRRSLWSDDTFVDFENGLNAVVNRLRETLSDTAKKPRFIETSPRRGYRFIAEVRLAGAPETMPAAAPTHEAPAAGERRPPRRALPRRWLAGGAAVLALLGLAIAGWRAAEGRRAKPPAIHSLAVLPLENLSADPAQSYFADGMTEALITALGQIDAVRVISRTSVMVYQGKRVPLAQIGRDLKVDAVVEGSVAREGSRVRVTAQLIYVPTDSHIWAANYEREGTDVLALEDEVARAIAAQVRARLTPQEERLLASSPQVNARAYEAYLQSRFLIENERTAEAGSRSVEYAREALSLDPNFALGYAGLAQSYASLSYLGGGAPVDLMPKAQAAAEKAVQLDPALDAAHTALGGVLLTYEYDWERAGNELRRAVALAPNDSDAHRWYGNYLLALGRFDSAIAEMRRAQELDPLSMWTSRDVGRALYFARRYDEAIAQLRKARELSPDHAVVDNWIGWAYEQKGMGREALRALLADAVEQGASPGEMALLRKAAATAGVRGYTRAMLYIRRRSPSATDPYRTARLYARLGDRAQAFEWLDAAYDQRSVWLTWVAVDPGVDPLRSDPRFQDLLRRMQLAR
jgi:TolB-like protein/DNA-binding winged helix-turn-helix (wHTH) protein/Tfp pilus assembly protein PilF